MSNKKQLGKKGWKRELESRVLDISGLHTICWKELRKKYSGLSKIYFEFLCVFQLVEADYSGYVTKYYLMNYTGYERRHVEMYLQALDKLGFIVREEGWDDEAIYKCRTYSLSSTGKVALNYYNRIMLNALSSRMVTYNTSLASASLLPLNAPWLRRKEQIEQDKAKQKKQRKKPKKK